MDHSNQPRYQRLDINLLDASKYENSCDGDELGMEDDELLHARTRYSRKFCDSKVSKILVLANLCLTVALLGNWIAIAFLFRGNELTRAPKPPYSPVREDGFIEYVNKQFEPQQVFLQEEGEELEAAWNATLGPGDGIIQLPKEISDKLSQTTEIYYEPGQYVYGISVFHQLHCLNVIRKSFYPQKFFPKQTDGYVKFHKNHCIDFIRQSIMCSADISMAYWWNSNYSYKDADGVEHLTKYYLDKTPKERAYGSYLMWDVEHQCRNLDLITDWVAKHQVREDEYIRAIEHKEDNLSEIHDDE